MSTIGFIGLGTMGGSFALNLIKAGFDLVVNDLQRQVAERQLAEGATWAGTPRAVGEAADVVLTSLPGPPEVAAVALDGDHGLIAGLSPGNVLFDLSTNSPTKIRELHNVRTLGQGPSRLHFGLGAVHTIDRLEVLWPGGAVSLLEGLAPRRVVTAYHPDVNQP